MDFDNRSQLQFKSSDGFLKKIFFFHVIVGTNLKLIQFWIILRFFNRSKLTLCTVAE